MNLSTRALCLTAAVLMAAGCDARHVRTGRRVIVLGVDGLDYQLARDLMSEGRMPNFKRLSTTGRFSSLATSTPPQSPVAWSTFITGVEPVRHRIFDFIHRDPRTMVPFLSTSRTVPGRWTLPIWRWQFPLIPDRVESLRRGETFWKILEDRGVETTIIRMPANFPPSREATRELSGMGTPDLLGTYGTFTWFTSRTRQDGAGVAGGAIVPVELEANVVRGTIEGPENPYLVESQKTQVEFRAYIDVTSQYVKLVVGDEQRLLRIGEWSDWVPIELKLVPSLTLAGECRFYVRQIEPTFEMYASPINIDPVRPALPISTPSGYAAELAGATGRFYTQGMPEDSKSLKAGVLTTGEFLEQARIVRTEAVRQFKYIRERFRDGLFFYYIGNIDQVSHMVWRSMDPGHPAYSTADAQYRTVLPDLYAEIDQLVGETASLLQADDLLVVMSDHGFTSWRRSFSLNAWLREKNYLAVKDPAASDAGLFANVDWRRTRAYGLGLNGLYLNVRGREANGIVDAAERETLAAEIARGLEAALDPATGERAIARVFNRTRADPREHEDDLAPDLIIGYAKGTRASDASSLGVVAGEVFGDNVSAWTGDHCMNPDDVPGILLVSRPLRKPATSLRALAGAIVAEFGIDGFPATREEE